MAEPGSVYSGVSVRAQDKKSGTGCSVEQHRNRPTVLTGLPDLGGFGRLGERSLNFVLQHADGSAVKLLGHPKTTSVMVCGSQQWTTSTEQLVATASRNAQRSAARLSGDPSIPTTIRCS